MLPNHTGLLNSKIAELQILGVSISKFLLCSRLPPPVSCTPAENKTLLHFDPSAPAAKLGQTSINLYIFLSLGVNCGGGWGGSRAKFQFLPCATIWPKTAAVAKFLGQKSHAVKFNIFFKGSSIFMFKVLLNILLSKI